MFVFAYRGENEHWKISKWERQVQVRSVHCMHFFFFVEQQERQNGDESKHERKHRLQVEKIVLYCMSELPNLISSFEPAGSECL